MNCSEALALILEGGQPGAELGAHLSGCERCRGAQRAAALLGEAGESLRTQDLPVSRLYDTRRRAAALIAEREPARAARPWPGWRMAVGAGALALILVSVVSQLSPRGGAPLTPARQPLAVEGVRFELDDDIEELSRRVDAGFRLFRSRHLASTGAVDLETRAAVLRARIAGRWSQVLAELSDDG